MGGCAVAAAATAAAAGSLGRSRMRQLARGALVAVGPALAGSVSLTRFDLWPVALVALALWALAARRDGLAGAAARARRRGQAVARARAAGRPRRRRAAGHARAAGSARCSAPACRSPSRSASRPAGSGTRCRCRADGRCRSRASAPPRCAARGARGRRPVLGRHVLGLAEPAREPRRRRRRALDRALDRVGPSARSCSARGRRCARPTTAAALSELARWTLAAVAAGIAFGHVLSPQFVLWLLPFPLLVAGRRGLVARGARRRSRACSRSRSSPAATGSTRTASTAGSRR